MNTFLVLVIFAQAMTLSLAGFKELYSQYAADCKTQLNANEEDSVALGSFEIPKNEAQSCLVDCLYNKLGLIVDGKLSEQAHKNISVAIAGNDKEKLAKMDDVFQKCMKEVPQGADQKCTVGKALRACVVKYAPEVQKMKYKPTS
uniref:Odorant binding protein n=1 Tax=Paracoccus marginatus TaxID=252483 RepID=A0AA51WBZ1_9HEMI|nr:odorant binding protein [Paracoccus marginatus]